MINAGDIGLPLVEASKHPHASKLVLDIVSAVKLYRKVPYFAAQVIKRLKEALSLTPGILAYLAVLDL